MPLKSTVPAHWAAFNFGSINSVPIPITAEITEHDVDKALEALVARGKLKPGINGKPAKPTGEPLAGSTINRFISTLAGIFKYARRVRALPRSHTPPTRGIEKAPEPVDPDKYFRPEEVDDLVKVARVVDQKWRKMISTEPLAFTPTSAEEFVTMREPVKN